MTPKEQRVKIYRTVKDNFYAQMTEECKNNYLVSCEKHGIIDDIVKEIREEYRVKGLKSFNFTI